MFDTIVAIATAPGNSGIGIVRLSGNKALKIANSLTKFKTLKPRHATLCSIYDTVGKSVDTSILLYFKAPFSYTGEDVIEIQAHGGSILLQEILHITLSLGARLAEPGEFTKRAYLNNKINLHEADAVVNIINAKTTQALRAAQNSLNGMFSQIINEFLTEIIHLRVYIEAAIDFPEEEIDFLQDQHIWSRVSFLHNTINTILKNGRQTQLMLDGLNVVIIGKPNVGKSSLMNALSEDEIAIVSDIPGTTRDIIKTQINLDGLLLNILDTAGIRETDCTLEKIGILKAEQALQKASLILFVYVVNDTELTSINAMIEQITSRHDDKRVILIANKNDIEKENPLIESKYPQVSISAKNGFGLDSLRELIKTECGFMDREENSFLARAKHIAIINRIKVSLENGLNELKASNSLEILAFELQQAQMYLSEITGEFSSDDLLGEIFSNFCIGK